MTNANPSVDPADTGTLTGLLRTAFRKEQEGLDYFIPVRVIGYDRPSNRAEVQPLIQLLDTSNACYSRGQIASVPALRFGGGGCVLSFSIKPGDLGWILAADRDISIFLQSYQESKPQTLRIRSFSDSLFIPDKMTGVTIAEEDQDNAVLQTADGTVKVTVGSLGITLSSPSQPVNVVASVINASAPNINLIASNMILATTPLFRVKGDINAQGSITPNVPPPP